MDKPWSQAHDAPRSEDLLGAPLLGPGHVRRWLLRRPRTPSFLRSLNNQEVQDQVWINRYSLALAFIAKSALTAAMVIAYAQKLWQSLYATRNGVSVRGIDALFTVLGSPAQFRVWDMWRSAPAATIMAAAIWLLPLAAVVSPTALTVGTLTQYTTDSNCLVPTLDLSTQPSDQEPTSKWTLTTVDYTGSYFNPSMTAQRLVGLASRNGRQAGWSSPCGPNCTYEVGFVAPSWECSRTEELDDPTAVWRTPELNPNAELMDGESYWFAGYGDGSNYSINGEIGSNLEYNAVYAGGVNPNTTQFWFGVMTPGLPVNLSSSTTVKGYLDPHIYSCDLFLSKYQIRVTYSNGLQENDILNTTTMDRLQTSYWAWNGGSCDNSDPNAEPLCSNSTQLDAVSLSRVMIKTVQGTITRDPREVLFSNTTIALVPTLVEDYNGTNVYGEMEPGVPRKNLGPLLEDLSHNVSLSLMSEPNLLAVGQAKTACSSSRTLTVWKYNPVPLAVAYGVAVAVTLFGLGAGGYALVSSRVARDTSFSSVVRTTRGGQMDMLCPDQAGLPMDHDLRKFRVKLDWGPDGSDQFRIVSGEKQIGS
jgi:hypothetical protein